jgi:hypothetical protein
MDVGASNASAVYLDGLIRVVVGGGGASGVEARHLGAGEAFAEIWEGNTGRGEEDRTGNSGVLGEGFERGIAFA